MLNEKAVQFMQREESKGDSLSLQRELSVESFSAIQEKMPISSHRPIQFDNLADLINRMSSFDPSLFSRLIEIVLSNLQPTDKH